MHSLSLAEYLLAVLAGVVIFASIWGVFGGIPLLIRALILRLKYPGLTREERKAQAKEDQIKKEELARERAKKALERENAFFEGCYEFIAEIFERLAPIILIIMVGFLLHLGWNLAK